MPTLKLAAIVFPVLLGGPTHEKWVGCGAAIENLPGSSARKAMRLQATNKHGRLGACLRIGLLA